MRTSTLSARSQTNIPFHDFAVEEPPELHSGARLAARLNARIIVNGSEFNNAGEMSVEDRRLYHEALEAAFPPGIALVNGEAGKTSLKKESLIVVTVRSCLRLAHQFFGLNAELIQLIFLSRRNGSGHVHDRSDCFSLQRRVRLISGDASFHRAVCGSRRDVRIRLRGRFCLAIPRGQEMRGN